MQLIKATRATPLMRALSAWAALLVACRMDLPRECYQRCGFVQTAVAIRWQRARARALAQRLGAAARASPPRRSGALGSPGHGGRGSNNSRLSACIAWDGWRSRLRCPGIGQGFVATARTHNSKNPCSLRLKMDTFLCPENGHVFVARNWPHELILNKRKKSGHNLMARFRTQNCVHFRLR